MRRYSRPELVIVCLIIALMSCAKHEEKIPDSLFQILDQDKTGIAFNNKLHESDSLNILTYLYYYNGGGVAIGDINNDGLPDIYFSGNQVSNKLYLNKGGMKFSDITEKAGVGCKGAWNTGVSMVDVNADGLQDIYVCQVDNIAGQKGRNQLFVNLGDLRYKESAQEYGLDFKGLSTQAAFFDFDRDGDLDCYLLNHSLKNSEQFRSASVTRKTFDPASGDRLLENQQGHFIDDSEKAGIYRSSIGFGLGIAIGDLNRDGWADIYVGNDFHENDYMYLNNQNGTFREVIAQATGHTSNFTMGVTIADINNDAKPDVLSLDMKPEDEKIYKMAGGWETFNIYEFKRSFGYHHQSPRNALQINQGIKNEIPLFSELACQYGIEATDWSWSPLVADFNGDGYKDIFISNGIERRPNDIDFVNYYSNENLRNKISGMKLINIIPHGGSSNYLFVHDAQSNSFKKIFIPDIGSKITNGASYSDLDRDGDLDIVCNNLNSPSYILQNNNPTAEYISIQLKDVNSNPFGLGSQIILYQNNKVQYQYLHHLSGFQSGKEPLAYFATNGEPVDSILIQWPEGDEQVMLHPQTGFQIIGRGTLNLFFPTKKIGIDSISSTAICAHHENSFLDMNEEKGIPYTLSSFGPRIAIGKKYYYVTDAAINGTLHRIADDVDVSYLMVDAPVHISGFDENDAAFADFNNDGHEDLFISMGGNTVPSGKESYQNRLFFGSADGTFHLSKNVLPKTNRNSSVVRVCDYDKDGDIDVFVGTLSRPGHYGWSEPSILYINNGHGSFSLQEVPVWEIVFDAQWSDMDQDGLQDLVILGHWMPVTILYNRKSHWEMGTMPNSSGLWFSLHITDLNQDSIPDIIAGNFGHNQPFKADSTYPLILYLNDFDLNGQSDPIFTYVKEEKRYIYPNLTLFLEELPGRKKDFVFNKDFAGKELQEIFPQYQLDKATKRKCNELSSGVFLSDRNLKNWTFTPLPSLLQESPIWSICRIDQERFAFGGNFYAIEPNWGRQDALFLTVMKYDNNTGWVQDEKFNNVALLRNEVRDLRMIRNKLYVASNNDTLISIPLRTN